MENLILFMHYSLTAAFARLEAIDDEEGDSSQKALDEYRNTFRLEKQFLDELRKGVSKLISRREQGEDVDTFQKSASTFATPSEGSFTEDSMLSIVFEDGHSSSKSPSDQPVRLL